MKSRIPHVIIKRRALAIALLGVLWAAFSASAQSAGSARKPAIGPGKVIIQTPSGADISGYDVDPNGTEGLVTEGVLLNNGRYDFAVATFDQRTGKIIKVEAEQKNILGDFITLGVFGNSTGLVEYEHVSRLFVNKRIYGVINPLDGNKLTGSWTPPLQADDIIYEVGRALGFPDAAFLYFENNDRDEASLVFSSNVGANTFGPVININDQVFARYNSPVMAYDGGTNQAVVAASPGCPKCGNTVALVDLATGVISEFPGLGLGFVNGIAVDPNTGIACTSTEIDFSVEFYNLATQTGIIVRLPGATNQAQSGLDVEVDPIHKLFLVGQEVSSTAPSGSSIQVFDEQGNFVESLNGFGLPATPVYMALHPSERAGYVYNQVDSRAVVQSFTY